MQPRAFADVSWSSWVPVPSLPACKLAIFWLCLTHPLWPAGTAGLGCREQGGSLTDREQALPVTV